MGYLIVPSGEWLLLTEKEMKKLGRSVAVLNLRTRQFILEK